MKASHPSPGPSIEPADSRLLRYRKSLVLVAVVSALCGIVVGVYAVAPLREPEVKLTLAAPLLRTAVPLEEIASSAKEESLQPTGTSVVGQAVIDETRSVSIDLEPATDDELLNINTASAAQLEALPGIGPSRAQDIIAYREEHGNFSTIEEITMVSGIGEGTLGKIAPYITVGDTQE